LDTEVKCRECRGTLVEGVNWLTKDRTAGRPWCRNCDNAARKQWNQDNPVKYLFGSARHRAKKRGYEFTITLDDIVIPKKCPLLGLPLVLNIGHVKENSASIDRIDSSKGYVPGNVWVISYKANTIKTNASLEDIEKVARNFRKYLNNKRGKKCLSKGRRSLSRGSS